MNARSDGVYGYAAACSGLASGCGRPARSCRKDSAAGPVSHRARSSVSAQTALTATIAWGCCSHRDGRKCCRYSASAGTVLAALK